MNSFLLPRKIITGWRIIACCAAMLHVSFIQARTPDRIANAKDYSIAHPENKGLNQLIEAVEIFDLSSSLKYDKITKEIGKNGWTKPYPEIQQMILSQSIALEAAVKAANAAPFDLPPYIHSASPLPDFLASQQIARLLTVKARHLESAGDLQGATLRAIEAARFGAIFSAKDQSLISHLISIACVSMTMPVFESLLNNPQSSPQTIQSIGKALYSIEHSRTDLIDAIKLESQICKEALSEEQNNPAKIKQIISDHKQSDPENASKFEMMIADLPKARAEIEQIMNLLVENESKPFWERQYIDKNYIKSMAENDSTAEWIPNYSEAGVRETLMLARMRQAQRLCAERLKLYDAAEKIQDPFTGQPFKSSAQMIYSPGPDKTDQGGAIIYDPTNGTISAGDVVLMRAK